MKIAWGISRHTRARLTCLVTSGLMISGAGLAEESEEAWQALGKLRESLAASPQQAQFVQEYLPAGFSSGDSENGDLFLALPECVRWDYREPYPKVFLLCASEIYTWNPGESAGRRFSLSDSEEPGIDLLRLRLDELEQRYEATLESAEKDLVVVLLPHSETFALAEARLTIDRTSGNLVGLAYTDRDGNRSTFVISDYQPLSQDARFEPPTGLSWMDE